ncbi:MAG: apolipoprotein N-acyltransferase [Candidatus Margulisiibacteriota bacterium]
MKNPNSKSQIQHWKVVISALSGILLSLAFPNADLGFFAWVAVAPFFVMLFSANKRTAILYGLSFGFSYFLAVFFWLTSLSRWIGPFAYLAWISLSMFQTLFLAAFSLVAYFVVKRYGLGLISSCTVPLLWILTEVMRSRGEFATAGGVLGYTQYDNPMVIQIASLLRVYGVSYLIISVNFALAALIIFKKDRAKARPAVLFSCCLLVASLTFGAWRMQSPLVKDPTKEFRIVIVQPSFDQAYKMGPTNSMTMLQDIASMTGSTLSFKPHAVIWPETAVMGFPQRSPFVMELLSRTAVSAEAFLVTGGFFYDSGKFYNSAFSVSSSGYLSSRYDKEHLMPFGEYLPFRPLLYPLLKSTGYVDSDQSPNPSPLPLYVGGRRVGVLICFESLFDNLAANRAKKSDFLLTITNDAWFGSSAAAHQHIMAGPFRAVENNKYFVQVANSGISAVIDPHGRFVAKSRLWEKICIEAIIYPDIAGR